MNTDVCHEMHEGEMLNATHTEWPCHTAILYGDRISTAKFSKRLSCAIRHLPLRLLFHFEYDTLKAIEAGVTTAPSLKVDDTLFLEGLLQAEEITATFEALLKR